MATDTQKISLERVGARLYVTGNTYGIKDHLKSAGCTWDGERRQWWAGLVKADQLQAVVDQANGGGLSAKEDLTKCGVAGKVIYKGRAYYVIATSRDGQKLRLTVLDGAIVFWADAGLCTWSKRYESRPGSTPWKSRQLPTLGSIQQFVERQKNPDTARVQCPECGSWCDAGQRCRDCGGC